MGRWLVICSAIVATVIVALVVHSSSQAPPFRSVDAAVLREYEGTYQWSQDSFVYLQLWSELSGKEQLVAFDETGELRTLYRSADDTFFSGEGCAVPDPIESEIDFQRDSSGTITSLIWRREGAPPRTARRVEIEIHEDVHFANGSARLAGTLIRPKSAANPAAMILVHGSGPADRRSMLPFARFLIRHGIAVLTYDKRGVGGSTGDWSSASFEDLADDVIAALEYLKTRSDIDHTQIGLLGVSQAGWVMPLAATKARDVAFLISVSGPGVPAAETTIDHARNEMAAGGMRPQRIEQIVNLMKFQYTYARTGKGWEEYTAARSAIAARLGGTPPDTFPGTADHPTWRNMKRIYFYDPAPVLRQLQTPTLAIFGELDNNVIAEKNRAAWEAALKSGGNLDYTLKVLPKANHIQLEAKLGSNSEMASLQRFVPEYSTTIRDWLAARLKSFGKAE